MTFDILALYMTAALIMPTAARRHPAMKTRFRFRFRLVWSGGKRNNLNSRQTNKAGVLFLFHVLIPVLSAALLRRSGPWEIKWFALWMTASLLLR